MQVNRTEREVPSLVAQSSFLHIEEGFTPPESAEAVLSKLSLKMFLYFIYKE